MEDHELTECRGKVITEFIMIEAWIDMIIAKHYQIKDDNDFILDVLNNQYFDFGLKYNILEKFLGTPKWMQDLRELGGIRNHFAHSGRYKYASDAEPDNFYFPSPKNKEKKINFDELYKTFFDKAPDILKELIDIFKKKGGSFVAEPEVNKKI